MATKGMENLQNLKIQKLNRRVSEIFTHIWTPRKAVAEVAIAETDKHLSVAEASKLKFIPMKQDHPWGKPWSTAWFRIKLTVPKEFAGHPVVLVFDSEGECIIFRNGKPVQGLDRNRSDYPLFEKCRGGEKLELFIEAGANGAAGSFKSRTAHMPEVAIYNPEVWEAYHSLSALTDMTIKTTKRFFGDEYTLLEVNDTQRSRIIFELDKAIDTFDYHNTDTESLKTSALRVQKALTKTYARKSRTSAQTIACMGHAHIDVAWLWPLRETIRKCARTFSNVLDLMERYPEFIFCQSQPHLYEFTRDNYPTIYKRIQKMAKKGQWIPTGCMWVEPDCNVTSGESLVRQVLFGTRFFEKEFNTKVASLWLPDVFGYSAALPQILKRSGINYFLTQKISWNQFTRFPYHSFNWEGIDGSRVLSHFPPANTYNSTLSAPEVLMAERNYSEKDRSPIQAIPFGFGDGGGGPTKEHLERMRRYSDLDAMPRLKPMTPRDFFETLEKESADLPEWVGELYLELHRGTLTTQAYNKRFNRLSEFALRDAEIVSSLLMAEGGRYEQEELNGAWKTVLLNQFHDIIPGSSIDLVYQDSDSHYAEVLESTRKVMDKAMSAYTKKIDTRGDGAPVVLFNSLGWERQDTVEVEPLAKLPGKNIAAVSSSGEAVPAALGADGKVRFRAAMPSLGHTVYHLREAAPKEKADTLKADEKGMENDLIRIRFDKNGLLRSIYDKVNKREALAPREAGNQFILFEDKPNNWDAWDVDIFYTSKPLETGGELQSIEVVECDAVRAVVRMVRTISNSVIRQDIILNAGSRRVDFKTTVEWGDEKNVFLKVAFPVDIHADKARYEIQFGSLERPTHWNMPQDFGRFEVTGHKWADLCEGNYGVALLNDCKYGYDIRGNVMRLSLLRAPKEPDPNADVNKHHFFTYAIMPHTGDFKNGVVREGYELNCPVQAEGVKKSKGSINAISSALEIDSDNVIIDTLKKAEDDKSLIVRLYEAHGCRGRYTLNSSLPIKKIIETDLMEREEKTLATGKQKVKLDFTPFQIRTLKLTLK